jgi:hypothetical protein
MLPIIVKDKILHLSFFSPRKSTASDFKTSSVTPNFVLTQLKKTFIKMMGYPYVLVTCLYLHLVVGRNKIVVCDRYFIQFLIDIYGTQAIHVLKFIPRPDMVFYIKGSLELISNRMTDSFDTSIKKQYYINVLCNFEKIAQRYYFTYIDASKSIDDVSNKIFLTVSVMNLHSKRILHE